MVVKFYFKKYLVPKFELFIVDAIYLYDALVYILLLGVMT